MLIDDKELIKSILDEIRMIREEMTAMKIVAIKQESNLKIHMKRSDELEAQTEILRDQLEPLKKHVSMVEGALKLIGVLSLISTIILGIVEVAKHLN